MVSGGEGFPVLNNKEVEISTTECILNHECMTNLRVHRLLRHIILVDHQLFISKK